MSLMQPYTPKELRQALGRYATGVTVITARSESGPVGITANSFASVSLDPPLVLWLPAKASTRFAPFTEAETFAIHVMGAEQHDLCQAFVKDGQAFPHGTRSHDDGTPFLPDCLARFHCARYAVHDAGDHAIVVGRVLEARHRPGDPLVFSAGSYGGFSAP